MTRTKALFALALSTLVAAPASASESTTATATATASATESAAVDPYPLEYWALRSVVTSVSPSPDGERIAMLKIIGRDGNPALYVHDIDDMDADPFVVGADPMEITGYQWVSDTHLVMTLRQKVRDRIEGFNQGVYDFALAIVDVENEDIDKFDMENPAVENALWNDPERIIVSMQPGGTDQKIAEPFRPRAYYLFNLERGTRELLIRGKIDLGQIVFDEDGDPWFARGYDVADEEFIWYIREQGDSGWSEMYRLHQDSFESFTVHGNDDAVAGNLLVSANNGDNTVGFYSFNPRQQSFDELIYQRSDVDVAGVRYHSNAIRYPNRIVAVAYRKDKLHFEYLDEVEGAMWNQLQELIPYSYNVSFVQSRNGEAVVALNSGPQDPGTYYLYHDGEFTSVGSRQPLLASEDLAPVQYIEYEARDGMLIRGFVTIPHGEGPYPLVVMPHGGPFVNETVAYDEWGQMLANNGYMVLQPQYRGSTGYGLDYYTTAFIDGGQGGYQMQDDKDDGALFLVEQGVVDPDRIAMFGWSYGGYAALIAAAREDQIYQCVIAGAAVTDPLMQVNYYRDRVEGAQLIEQENMWVQSISPIEEVENVNVPLLLVHGDVDQRVPPVHAAKYRRALEEHGKDFEYLELEGADHFSNTLFYHHQLDLYTHMIGYLQNECGPDGL
ncbi:MAG: prolyl oligopeptidase family serine peptidase [Woeseiaceae bacterium]|nr:prolyl oligopeptidase family serine peptidase [Woeseiaceae bacterium]